MTAAVALAVVLVIAVTGMSLAMQSQRPITGNPGATQPPRQPPPPRRTRERRAPAPSPPPKAPDPVESVLKEPESKGPELLRTGTPAAARVLSVVDERTVGPVTRSRLNLAIDDKHGKAFEITVRFAFPTPSARSRVKVGGTVPVRYDPDDHSRVVLDLPA